ncbi:hypothetical protein [Escherichia coli]|uniref:hypothetical protein n=1 Tax=Escherichia coli TaxID=562 RepID=UPI0024B76FC4|nr:hypothetical protein [Escherichia coli]
MVTDGEDCRVWSAERWSGVRFTPVSGCGELRQRKQDADPEQEVIAAGASSSAANERGSASFVLSTPTKRMGVFPGRSCWQTCTWTYRGDECGYTVRRRG